MISDEEVVSQMKWPTRSWTEELTELMRRRLQDMVDKQGYHVEVKFRGFRGYGWFDITFSKTPDDVTHIVRDTIVVEGQAAFLKDNDIYWELLLAETPAGPELMGPQEGFGDTIPILPRLEDYERERKEIT